MNSSATQKDILRRLVRALRKNLSPIERQRAAEHAARQALKLPALRRARDVAVYLASGSELPTAPLIAALQALGKRLYVPRIGRDSRMRFVRLHAGQALRRNRHGIAEPIGRAPQRGTRRLDLILLPLLAFDARGYRLGSGGGYYDRALAQERAHGRPRRVGYAYALQQIDAVPAEAWDVRLDAVVTESGTIIFS